MGSARSGLQRPVADVRARVPVIINISGHQAVRVWFEASRFAKFATMRPNYVVKYRLAGNNNCRR